MWRKDEGRRRREDAETGRHGDLSRRAAVSPRLRVTLSPCQLFRPLPEWLAE